MMTKTIHPLIIRRRTTNQRILFAFDVIYEHWSDRITACAGLLWTTSTGQSRTCWNPLGQILTRRVPLGWEFCYHLAPVPQPPRCILGRHLNHEGYHIWSGKPVRRVMGLPSPVEPIRLVNF
jgi:hypothetical protein